MMNDEWGAPPGSRRCLIGFYHVTRIATHASTLPFPRIHTYTTPTNGYWVLLCHLKSPRVVRRTGLIAKVITVPRPPSPYVMHSYLEIIVAF